MQPRDVSNARYCSSLDDVTLKRDNDPLSALLNGLIFDNSKNLSTFRHYFYSPFKLQVLNDSLFFKFRCSLFTVNLILLL